MHAKYLIIEPQILDPEDFVSAEKMRKLESLGYKIKKIRRSTDAPESLIEIPEGTHCVFARVSNHVFPKASTTYTLDAENTFSKILDDLIKEEEQKKAMQNHPASNVRFFAKDKSGSLNGEERSLLEHNKNHECCIIL